MPDLVAVMQGLQVIQGQCKEVIDRQAITLRAVGVNRIMRSIFGAQQVSVYIMGICMYVCVSTWGLTTSPWKEKELIHNMIKA